MAKDMSSMSPVELWQLAERSLRSGELRTAKAALDELGLRFDDAYSRLEEKITGSSTEGKAWS